MKSSFLFSLLLLAIVCRAQVVINEVHVRPAPDTTGVQSQSLTYCADTTYGTEWIELYNTSKCDTIDLGCYFLGSRMADTNYGTFAFPANARILPLDFVVVGGKQAPNVDYAIPDFCTTADICGVGQWFLPDDYGWIALYQPDGTIADAIFWTPGTGQAGQLITNPAFSDAPCIPSSCNGTNSLEAAADMTPGSEILYAGKAPFAGTSIYRQSDGGTPWLTDGVSTPGQCNANCAPPTDLNIVIDSFKNETCLQANGWATALATGGTLPYDLDWTPTANGDSIGNLSAGAYSVTVTDAENCMKWTSFTIINIGVPDPVAVNPPGAIIFKGESVVLNLVTAATIDSVFWTPATGLSCVNCASPVASPNTITTYNVRVVDTDGCEGDTTVTVEVLSDENSTFIPTAFTPDDDGNNDVLFVRSPKLVGLELHIYDRWGNEVFTTKDPSVGWDGRDKNGNAVDVGIYVYYALVTFDNMKSKTLKGNVGVIR